MSIKLSLDEIEEMLSRLDGWELALDRITKKFVLGDFKQAMEFVTDVAVIAEEANHHPDISISYNTVTLTLFTHSENHLTEKDFRLAESIDELSS